eukprot:TRINITY_DN84290_c0_g1_i1.p1 TRINITY_DN84290_c0_g1~~TRINITY_DN84290_c0_g1_i1.p1  ORF type:complete len:383 (-),score=45.94 TRINITY_DN84290_c0_g1_i1:220-1368(-)
MISLLLLLGLLGSTVAHEADEAPPGADTQAAGWSCECDPWNGCGTDDIARVPVASDYVDCPPEKQSPSGCGDFEFDPRAERQPGGACFADGAELRDIVECGGRKDIQFGFCMSGAECREKSANKRLETFVAEPNVFEAQRTGQIPIAQKHYCIDKEIPFPRYTTVDNSETAPVAWLHRDRWPKWGVYDFIPPQRWLHASEHGGFIILYHPCLADKWVRRLQDYAASVPPDDGGNFRFILTPYHDLRRSIAIVTWSGVTYMGCYNEAALDDIYQKQYRRAWEDWGMPGAYDYLWTSWTYSTETLAASCVNTECPQEVDHPVCGSDGRTYPNSCYLKNAQCVRPTLEVAYKGYCGDVQKKSSPTMAVNFENRVGGATCGYGQKC